MIRQLPYFAALALTSALHAADFKIERMPNPAGIDPQIGGMDVLPDGRVVAAFHRGEVQIFDPASQTWSSFAEGMHEPLGLLAESPTSILVMQRAELTRLKDSDGDGKADVYETVFDGFGMTGNYHEFAFGPAKGPDGSLFIGLNVASNGAGIRPEIRGKWSDIGDLDRAGMLADGGFGKRAGKAGRMYSRVPWRGWLLKLSPDGKSMQPYASGFRSPDGIGFDDAGNLLVTDNQGDWRGTSPLYVVQKGGFHGHPASLVWTPGWNKGDPLKLPVDELDKLRVKESARFPQGDLANSPTQPVAFPESWKDYQGQVVIGEMNQKRLVRFLPDDVGGFRQGTLVPMMDGTDLGNGNHRLVFGKDGALWVGKTHLSWAGDQGLVKVTLAGKAPLTAQSVELSKKGDHQVFTIRFNRPVKAPSAAPAVNVFGYKYHQAYGSPKTDEAILPVSGFTLSPDKQVLSLECSARAGLIHRLDLSGIQAEDGGVIEGKLLYYQATRLP